MAFYENREVLLKRLEIWTSRFIMFKARQKEIVAALADKGSIISTLPPVINSDDSLDIIDLKRELIYFHKETLEILEQIQKIGVIVADNDTMEILMPGGPDKNSFLSWVPGEPDVMYWRKSPDTNCLRESLDKQSVNNKFELFN